MAQWRRRTPRRHLYGRLEQSSVTLPVTEASSDRDTSECRRPGALSICPRQTIRDRRTDVVEPRPFHVPLIDTLGGPVQRGDATVMSPSLPVSRTVTLSTPDPKCTD